MAAMVQTAWLKRIDTKAGDGLEAVLRRHHRRRLGHLGWSEALSPRKGAGWWSTRAPVRSGNHVEVLVDGTEALAAMEAAIKAARTSVHIAGWHASPDFALTRGPGALPLRDLLADVAQRVPVRLLMWAGPPLPMFQPTRSMVHRAQTSSSETAACSVPSTGASGRCTATTRRSWSSTTPGVRRRASTSPR